MDLANPSIWKVASPDGGSFGGSVSETRDNINFLHISQAKPDGNDKSVAFSISDFLAVAGIDMNFSLGNDNWNYNILSVNGGKTLKTKGDFNIAMSLPIWSSIADLSVGSASAIGIGGNFTLRQSGGGVSILSVGGNESVSLFKVAENMVLSYGGINDLRINVENFEVGGVLSFSGNDVHMTIGKGSELPLTSVRLGGLHSVAEVGRLELAVWDKSTSLEFTNSSHSEFAGALVKSWQNNQSAFNITMNASDAANGRQILRFSSADPYTYDYSNADISGVSVKSGELSLGTHSEMSGGLLEVGGTNAVFSATGLVFGEVGMARFDEAWLSSGKIRFDFSEIDGCDKIVFAGAMNFAGDFEFEINLASADLAAWLEESGAEYLDYTIVEFGDTNITAGELAEMLKTCDGVMAELIEEDFANGKIALRLSAAAVPEPAVISSILGALALGCAILRGRRK